MLSFSPYLARHALDAAPDAIIVIDASGSIRFANRQVAILFGYEHEQIVGQNLENLLPERFRSQHVAHRAQYMLQMRARSMGQELALFGRRRDGSEFPVEISLSPLEGRGTVLVAATIRDVTERKRVEAELIAAREAAERERDLADAALRFAGQARDSADRANQDKSRFLASASHDLRQPLQSLALLTGTLRRTVKDREALEALLQQEQAIASMSQLVNALLDISKLESGDVKAEPTHFTVAAVFEQLRVQFADLAAGKGLRLEIEASADCAYSDPSLVKQILGNLLSNAIRYTRAGRVSLRSMQEGALVRIEVLDTGIGIESDQIPQIFEEFYQVGVPTNSAREGHGLGLSIVQHLVKLLALKLDVRSEVGTGSIFALLLPASSSQSVPPAPGSAPQARDPLLGPVRVLLVEDDEPVRNATRMLLKAEGYQVTAVASLAEAVKFAREGGGLDLLVSDYHLGHSVTGVQVLAALRETLGVSLKAVLVTGDSSAAIKGLANDADVRVASKPIRAEELLALLSELLIV